MCVLRLSRVRARSSCARSARGGGSVVDALLEWVSLAGAALWEWVCWRALDEVAGPVGSEEGEDDGERRLLSGG
jgi:hypothetical protein